MVRDVHGNYRIQESAFTSNNHASRFILSIQRSSLVPKNSGKCTFFKSSNPDSSVKINWVRRETTAAPACTVRQGLLLTCRHTHAKCAQQWYKNADSIPILHGDKYCSRGCLCSLYMCVTVMPPTFLRGMCGTHDDNKNKRHGMYSKFWGTLKDLGLLRDEEYLVRKENRIRRQIEGR